MKNHSPPPKFLCDQMLLDLAKWLRSAGYDTLTVASTVSDKEILSRAIHEHRILLTCDKHFLEFPEAEKNVIYFKVSSLPEYIHELNQQLKLHWLYRPFSRCLICNSLLEEASDAIILQTVPPQVLAVLQQFWYCHRCQKVYWLGSHTRNMLLQLQTWQKQL